MNIKNTIFHKTQLLFPLIIWGYLFSNSCFSQINEESVIYTEVEVYPEFPGGNAEFIKFLQKNAKWEDLSDCDYSKSKIYLRFVVEMDGSLSNIEALKGFCSNEMEIINEGLKNCPNWKSGQINGEKVRSYFTLPINIHLK